MSVVGAFLANLEREAVAEVRHIEAEAATLVHTVEKEIEMALPQVFTDAVARIQAALAAHSNQGAADAQTIAALQADKSELQGRLVDAQAQIADLTTQLNDATSQISDMENALLAISPA